MVSLGDKITYYREFIPVFHLQVETALGVAFLPSGFALGQKCCPLGLFPPVREILEYKFTVIIYIISFQSVSCVLLFSALQGTFIVAIMNIML